MPAEPSELTDANVNGPRTRCWRIEAADCAELKPHRIARLGLDAGWAPYRRVRLRPDGSFFLACVEGEGRILLDGRWQRVAEGMVCMAPPRVLNAFFAVKGKPFTIAWVRYDEPPWIKPLVGASSPVRGVAGGTDLARAIQGLQAEWNGARDAKFVHHWLSLVHGLASRLASPWQGNQRLWKLWDEVEKQPGAPWSLGELAKRAHLSAEHLRRLCLRELGRSPMHHVAYVRMQRARQLLEMSDDKLETLAPQVGYADPLVFSRAFRRWVGVTPTEYRAGGSSAIAKARRG